MRLTAKIDGRQILTVTHEHTLQNATPSERSSLVRIPRRFCRPDIRRLSGHDIARLIVLDRP